jgi:hypothetical protein
MYSDMVEFLEKSSEVYISDYKHMPWNFIYQHQFNFKDDGLFVQIGIFERERIFRIEFNPNKIKNLTFMHNIIKRVKHPNITRIDWAVDYQKDLSNCDFRQLTARKTIEYRSRSKQLETLYLGSLKSDKFIRIYNKALELKKAKIKFYDEEEKEIEVKETLWRVEAVVKDFKVNVELEKEVFIEHVEGSMEIEIPRKWFITGKNLDGRQISKEYDLIPEKRRMDGVVSAKKEVLIGYENIFKNPFIDLEIYEKYEGGSQGLKVAEKAMLFFLKYNPDEWGNLAKNTRKKYEELSYLYEWMMIEDQPFEVFEKEKNRLADELESLLKPVLDNTQTRIGRTSNLHYSLDLLRFQEKEKIGKKAI